MLVFSLNYGAYAQKADEVIWKAMKDELSRNLKNLSYLDYQKPFFISYAIGDFQGAVVMGSLGALVMSHEVKQKTEMVRVMVGDYKLADENFENANNQIRYAGGNIPLPVDADYYGIRRTLWVQTDKVYKAAGESHKNKLYILKRNNIPIDSLVPDLTQVPATIKKIDAPEYKFNKAEMESRIRELSSYFAAYPGIDNSGVSFRLAHVNTYFVNSEGAEVKSPTLVAVITLSAFTTSDDGLKIFDGVNMVVPNPEYLPGNAWIKQQIDTLATRLIKMKTAEVFSGNYTGPVLFVGQSVPELVSGSLFSQEDPLVAIREPLYADKNMKIFMGTNRNSLESRINKKVIAGDLTVKALPSLKEFNKTPLIGHFDIDADGVIPPSELVLVENGVLKTLLCDRTPTKMVPQSNGHRRFILVNNAVSYGTGPGVIELSSAKTNNMAELKQKLMEKAKEEGLDYAILVKRVVSNNPNVPAEIYKVSVNTGEEKLLRSVTFGNINLGTLRKCIGASSQQIAQNMLMNFGGGDGTPLEALSPDLSGLPVSFITPDALLISEMELEAVPQNLAKEKALVPNPLNK